MLVAFAAGLFALLGGFAGAALARRTEYEKWLRQERSASFAKFLQSVHDARMQAIGIIFNAGDTDERRAASDLRITEIFAALHAQVGIVRLYLDAKNRDRFSALARELYSLHFLATPQEKRMARIEPLTNELQTMFEQALHG